MWNEHFTEKEDVIIGEDKFRVYFLNRDEDNKKPLLVLLHGGGYSALTWAHFSVNNLFALLYYQNTHKLDRFSILTDRNNGNNRLPMFGY